MDVFPGVHIEYDVRERIMKQIVFIIIGVFFLLLGLIGLLIPVVPQVPFLATGVLFLAGGSKRVQKRVFDSKLYKKHVQKHVENSRFLSRMVHRIVGELDENGGIREGKQSGSETGMK